MNKDFKRLGYVMLKLKRILMLMSFTASFGANGQGFLDYCLASNEDPATSATVEAVFNALKLWHERSIDQCQLAEEMVLKRKELDLYPYPEQRPRPKITTLKPIATFTHLQSLILAGNALSDLNELRNFTKLRSLNLTSNEITELSALSSLSELKELYLANNHIRHVSEISNLEQLQNLDLSHNELDALPQLASKHLSFLRLEANKISSLHGIEQFPELNELNTYANRISDVSPLQSLKLMSILDLGKNSINNVAVLGQLKQLRWLSVAHNPVADVAPFDQMYDLRHLKLRESLVTQLPAGLIALCKPHSNSQGEIIRLAIDISEKCRHN